MQGLIVGIIGTSLGLIFGISFVYKRNEIRDFCARFGIDLFPPDIYGFSSIPALIVPSDLFYICLGSIILCLAAAIIPAYIVTKLDAAKALRNE